MSRIKVIDSQMGERPLYFDFKKSEITGYHPSMDNLNYDPFPDRNDGDVVRTEIIRTELVWNLKVEGALDSFKMGSVISHDGKKFLIQKITEKINFQSDVCIMEIEAVARLSQCEPIAILKRLRAMYATNNHT